MVHTFLSVIPNDPHILCPRTRLLCLGQPQEEPFAPTFVVDTAVGIFLPCHELLHLAFCHLLPWRRRMER